MFDPDDDDHRLTEVEMREIAEHLRQQQALRYHPQDEEDTDQGTDLPVPDYRGLGNAHLPDRCFIGD